jgi:hypothetical protein
MSDQPSAVAYLTAFFERCVRAGCVVAPVCVYSQWGADGNIDARYFVGLRYAALDLESDVVGPDYYFSIDDGQTGEDRLYLSPEAALVARESSNLGGLVPLSRKKA